MNTICGLKSINKLNLFWFYRIENDPYKKEEQQNVTNLSPHDNRFVGCRIDE